MKSQIQDKLNPDEKAPGFKSSRYSTKIRIQVLNCDLKWLQ